MAPKRLCWRTAAAAFVAVLVIEWVVAIEPPDEYGARVDPWLKEHEQAVRVSEEEVLVLRLRRGELGVFRTDGSGPLGLPEDMREQLKAIFPVDAFRMPVPDDVWAQKVQRYSLGRRVDPACPVNGENHLERAIVEVFDALLGEPRWAMLNVGGLYGGSWGEGAELPDDPTVELLRHTVDAGMQVLCWNCGDVASVTRVSSLAKHFHLEDVSLLSPEMTVPPEFRDLDLLRLDFLPAGQSCQVLRRLLRIGVRPRLVAMLVQSQVPPPFRYSPLMAGTVDPPPEMFFSCSLAAAGEVLEPYDLLLVRLTGPYALFVHRQAWPEPLPISDMDCYRGAGVWGHRSVPIEHVRDWLFSSVGDALPRLWGNLSLLHGPGRPFALAV